MMCDGCPKNFVSTKQCMVPSSKVFREVAFSYCLLANK